MLKVLFWFVSKDKSYLDSAINVLERQHDGIEVVGLFVGEDVVEVDGGGVYDILLVVGARQIGMSEVTKLARQLKFPEEKLLGDWIVCIPGFTLEKYRQLQRSCLSIFSQNCFGGLLSHTLGLQFRSPFVNLYLEQAEFIHFLRAPRLCMDEKLRLKKMVWNDEFKCHHPIATLGNVDIVLNHYTDFDEAIKIWERQKERINWYNLFVAAYTEDEEFLTEFNTFPFSKKVCFVPFKSDLDSAWYVNPEIDFDRAEEGFYDVVNNFARGKIFYYDVFDMLLYGKKTQLIEM